MPTDDQPGDRRRATVVGGLVLGALAISSSSILARVAMGDDPGLVTATPGGAPALGVAFWRITGGALALLPLALRARRRTSGLSPVRRRQLAASGVAIGLHFALYQGSLAFTTVASSVTLVTMSPLFVTLGAWWFLGERSSRRTWIGVTGTIVGGVVIGLGDAAAIDLGGTALLGDAMALAGAVAVSVYFLLGRVARRDVPATVYSCIVYAWASVLLLGLCLALDVPLTGYDPRSWLAVLGLVVGPQLLGHSVFNAVLDRVPPTVVSVVVLSEPVGATLLAWWLLVELPAPLFWVGAPLVLVGVWVATAGRSRGARVVQDPAAAPGPAPCPRTDADNPSRTDR